MRSRIIKIAFWFSDTWAGLVCVICLIYAFTAPVMIPAYQKMSKLEETSIFLNLGISALLLSIAYTAYLIRKRNLLALVIFSIALCIFALYLSHALFLLCAMLIIWLPYILSFKEAPAKTHNNALKRDSAKNAAPLS